MGIDEVVLMGRAMLEEVLILVGPVLAVAITVSLLVNVLQTLTSLQDSTISTVDAAARNGSGAVFHDAVDVAAPGDVHTGAAV